MVDYWANSDFVLNLQEDWADFVAEVSHLIDTRPEMTVSDIVEETGAEFNDVYDAIREYHANAIV